MDKLMDNENLWHLRNQIFEDLSHEDVLKCRRVSKYWNESLRRMSAVKFIEEFGERDVESTNQKVSTIFPGWKKTVKKYCVQASNEDLEKVKDSLKPNLTREILKKNPDLGIGIIQRVIIFLAINQVFFVVHISVGWLGCPERKKRTRTSTRTDQERFDISNIVWHDKSKIAQSIQIKYNQLEV